MDLVTKSRGWIAALNGLRDASTDCNAIHVEDSDDSGSFECS